MRILLVFLMMLGTVLGAHQLENPNVLVSVGGSVAPTPKQGISDEVHRIIEYGENHTLEVPPGQMVRIVAKNRSMIVNDEVFPLNVELSFRVRKLQKEHVISVKRINETVEIEENNTKVKINATVRVTGSEILIGADEIPLRIMPSEVKNKIKLQRFNSIALKSINGSLIYEVEGIKRAKLLWLFDVELPIKVEIDAEVGTLKNLQKPWWAFLITSEEEK